MKAPVRQIRVYVVEDHVMVREGFVSLINTQEDMRVCGQSGNAREALEQIIKSRPDLALIDLVLGAGDGLELIKSIHARFPAMLILVVSMQDEEIYAERALHAGASGYVMKSSATLELLEAIRTVMTGRVYISTKMTSRILSEFRTGTSAGHSNDDVGKLSDRELEVFRLVGSGIASRKIAERLGISPKTVESHRENIKHKLGLPSGVALLQYASSWARNAAASAREKTPDVR